MKKVNNFAFIDSQNLNLGTVKDINKGKRVIYKGWKLDFKKFRQYLRDKFRITKAFLFIGYITQNEKMYNQLKSYGYILVFKQTVKDGHGKPKGNVDAEIILHASAIQFEDFDKAVVVSGDGDYYCLYEYLVKHKKLLSIIIPNKHSESSILKKFQSFKVFINNERGKLEFKP